MTNEELKEALLSKKPVIYGGSVSCRPCDYEYECVSAVIYRNSGGKIKVTAELTDKNGNSVMIVDPERVRYKDV